MSAVLKLGDVMIGSLNHLGYGVDIVENDVSLSHRGTIAWTVAGFCGRDAGLRNLRAGCSWLPSS
jgi:hypothetical protein